MSVTALTGATPRMKSTWLPTASLSIEAILDAHRVVRIGTTVKNWPGCEGEENKKEEEDEDEDEEPPQEEDEEPPQEENEYPGAVTWNPVDEAHANEPSDNLVYSDDASEDLLSSTPVFLKASPIPAGIVTRVTPKLAVAKQRVTDALKTNY